MRRDHASVYFGRWQLLLGDRLLRYVMHRVMHYVMHYVMRYGMH